MYWCAYLLDKSRLELDAAALIADPLSFRFERD